MPIPHGYEATSINARGPEFRFQGLRLPFGMPSDRRSTPDHRIMMFDLARPRGGNKLGQGPPPDPGKRKVNDVRVTEQIKEKWLNGFQRIGSAKLEQNYSNTCCSHHSPTDPQKKQDVTQS